jgi:hypothetical protein
MLALHDLLRTRTAQPSLNKALYFNGVNAWVRVGNVLDVYYGDFAVMGWFMTTSNFYDNEIVAKGASCSVGGWKVITQYGYLRGSFNNQGAAPYAECIYTGARVSDGRWHFFAFVVRGLKTAATRAMLYLDGSVVETKLNQYNPYMAGQDYLDTSTWDTRYPGALGIAYSEPVGAACPKYGNLYVASIMGYSRALSVSEITHNMLNPNNPVRDGLVLWLDARACDPAAGVCYDLSGTGNHGTMYNVRVVDLPEPVRPGGAL